MVGIDLIEIEQVIEIENNFHPFFNSNSSISQQHNQQRNISRTQCSAVYINAQKNQFNSES